MCSQRPLILTRQGGQAFSTSVVGHRNLDEVDLPDRKH